MLAFITAATSKPWWKLLDARCCISRLTRRTSTLDFNPIEMLWSWLKNHVRAGTKK
jgi:hypothetical protein